MKLLVELSAIVVVAAILVITTLIMSVMHMSSFGGRSATATATTTRSTTASVFWPIFGRMPNLVALCTLLNFIAIEGNMVYFPTMLAWLVGFRGGYI